MACVGFSWVRALGVLWHVVPPSGEGWLLKRAGVFLLNSLVQLHPTDKPVFLGAWSPTCSGQKTPGSCRRVSPCPLAMPPLPLQRAVQAVFSRSFYWELCSVGAFGELLTAKPRLQGHPHRAGRCAAENASAAFQSGCFWGRMAAA